MIGMIWLSVIFDEGDKSLEDFSLKSSESGEIEMFFEGTDIGYYKIFMPEFVGEGVFVQILDQNQNVISDGVLKQKCQLVILILREDLMLLRFQIFQMIR